MKYRQQILAGLTDNIIVQQTNAGKIFTHQRKRPEKPDIIYKEPEGSDEHVLHHANFFDSIRMGKPIFEGAASGIQHHAFPATTVILKRRSLDGMRKL